MALTAIGEQLVGFRVKLGRSRSDRDRAQLQRDAVEDLREGIGDDPALGGLGVDVEGVSDYDGAEVEGAGHGRGDYRDRHRGAFVGAGEVGGAAGVEGVGAGAGADRDACRCDEAGQLGFACSALPALAAAAARAASEQ